MAKTLGTGRRRPHARDCGVTVRNCGVPRGVLRCVARRRPAGRRGRSRIIATAARTRASSRVGLRGADGPRMPGEQVHGQEGGRGLDHRPRPRNRPRGWSPRSAGHPRPRTRRWLHSPPRGHPAAPRPNRRCHVGCGPARSASIRPRVSITARPATRSTRYRLKIEKSGLEHHEIEAIDGDLGQTAAPADGTPTSPAMNGPDRFASTTTAGRPGRSHHARCPER